MNDSWHAHSIEVVVEAEKYLTLRTDTFLKAILRHVAPIASHVKNYKKIKHAYYTCFCIECVPMTSSKE